MSSDNVFTVSSGVRRLRKLQEEETAELEAFYKRFVHRKEITPYIFERLRDSLEREALNQLHSTRSSLLGKLFCQVTGDQVAVILKTLDLENPHRQWKKEESLTVLNLVTEYICYDLLFERSTTDLQPLLTILAYTWLQWLPVAAKCIKPNNRNVRQPYKKFYRGLEEFYEILKAFKISEPFGKIMEEARKYLPPPVKRPRKNRDSAMAAAIPASQGTSGGTGNVPRKVIFVEMLTAKPVAQPSGTDPSSGNKSTESTKSTATKVPPQTQRLVPVVLKPTPSQKFIVQSSLLSPRVSLVRRSLPLQDAVRQQCHNSVVELPQVSRKPTHSFVSIIQKNPNGQAQSIPQPTPVGITNHPPSASLPKLFSIIKNMENPNQTSTSVSSFAAKSAKESENPSSTIPTATVDHVTQSHSLSCVPGVISVTGKSSTMTENALDRSFRPISVKVIKSNTLQLVRTDPTVLGGQQPLKPSGLHPSQTTGGHISSVNPEGIKQGTSTGTTSDIENLAMESVAYPIQIDGQFEENASNDTAETNITQPTVGNKNNLINSMNPRFTEGGSVADEMTNRKNETHRLRNPGDIFQTSNLQRKGSSPERMQCADEKENKHCFPMASLDGNGTDTDGLVDVENHSDDTNASRNGQVKRKSGEAELPMDIPVEFSTIKFQNTSRSIVNQRNSAGETNNEASGVRRSSRQPKPKILDPQFCSSPPPFFDDHILYGIGGMCLADVDMPISESGTPPTLSDAQPNRPDGTSSMENDHQIKSAAVKTNSAMLTLKQQPRDFSEPGQPTDLSAMQVVLNDDAAEEVSDGDTADGDCPLPIDLSEILQRIESEKTASANGKSATLSKNETPSSVGSKPTTVLSSTTVSINGTSGSTIGQAIMTSTPIASSKQSMAAKESFIATPKNPGQTKGRSPATLTKNATTPGHSYVDSSHTNKYCMVYGTGKSPTMLPHQLKPGQKLRVLNKTSEGNVNFSAILPTPNDVRTDAQPVSSSVEPAGTIGQPVAVVSKNSTTFSNPLVSQPVCSKLTSALDNAHRRSGTLSVAASTNCTMTKPTTSSMPTTSTGSSTMSNKTRMTCQSNPTTMFFTAAKSAGSTRGIVSSGGTTSSTTAFTTSCTKPVSVSKVSDAGPEVSSKFVDKSSNRNVLGLSHDVAPAMGRLSTMLGLSDSASASVNEGSCVQEYSGSASKASRKNANPTKFVKVTLSGIIPVPFDPFKNLKQSITSSCHMMETSNAGLADLSVSDSQIRAGNSTQASPVLSQSACDGSVSVSTYRGDSNSCGSTSRIHGHGDSQLQMPIHKASHSSEGAGSAKMISLLSGKGLSATSDKKTHNSSSIHTFRKVGITKAVPAQNQPVAQSSMKSTLPCIVTKGLDGCVILKPLSKSLGVRTVSQSPSEQPRSKVPCSRVVYHRLLTKSPTGRIISQRHVTKSPPDRVPSGHVISESSTVNAVLQGPSGTEHINRPLTPEKPPSKPPVKTHVLPKPGSIRCMPLPGAATGQQTAKKVVFVTKGPGRGSLGFTIDSNNTAPAGQQDPRPASHSVDDMNVPTEADEGDTKNCNGQKEIEVANKTKDPKDKQVEGRTRKAPPKEQEN